MKHHNRFAAFAILWLALAFLLSGTATAQLFERWEKVQACPGTDPTRGFWTLNGAESGTMRDRDIVSAADMLGYRTRILDYAPAVENILGLRQRPYLIWLRSNVDAEQHRGTYIYFHGGGGDRGFVDNLGDPTNPNTTSAMALFWLQSGYDVALVEYPRGWMDPQWCDDCPWNTSDAAYARQEAAARQSFRYAKRAVEYVRHRAKDGPLLVAGTSFGGAITLYLTAYAETGWPEAMGISAALVGYGGALESDPITDTHVPILFVGGLDDHIVPADGGNFYQTYRAIQGDGIRSSFEKYARVKGPAAAVFSAGGPTNRGYQPMGHTYGLFHDDLEVYRLFRDFAAKPWTGEEARKLTTNAFGDPVGYTIFGGEHTPSPDIPDCQ